MGSAGKRKNEMAFYKGTFLVENVIKFYLFPQASFTAFSKCSRYIFAN